MPTDSQGVILDIEAELGFWRQRYRNWPFHRRGLGFDAYVPTLKFGYDSYLLFHRYELGSLLPALKIRYTNQLPAAQRLDWACSQRIIRETWRRMQGEPADEPLLVGHAPPRPVAAGQAYGVSAD
jgi:hypothetical protein